MKTTRVLASLFCGVLVQAAALGAALAATSNISTDSSSNSSTSSSSSTTTTTTTTTNEIRDAILTARFGSRANSGLMGCKTEDRAEKAVKELKTDCSAWVQDQRENLKTKFLASMCEESCDDCSMGLKRCSVSGTIHYTLK